MTIEETASGRIAYDEAGAGPVALFVHGVLMNKHLWRRQLTGLGDIRRCIAPDHDVSVTANAHMLRELLDTLAIDQVDLVGNDSGGGICQIFAALNPESVRTLTLTNCDTHDNWPPEAFRGFVNIVRAGCLKDTLTAMLEDKAVYRLPNALGLGYENPESVMMPISRPTCARSCAPRNELQTLSGSSWLSISATRWPLNHSYAR